MTFIHTPKSSQFKERTSLPPESEALEQQQQPDRGTRHLQDQRDLTNQ